MGHLLDAAIADVAAKRHGLVSSGDLVRLQVPRHARDWRVSQGRLEVLSELVFRMPGSVRTPQQALLAAVIDAGPGAVATRRSGAALWGVPGFGWGPSEVLIKRSGDHLCRLGRLSETSWLPANHVTERDGIPVVTLARLCFELAATEHPKRTERVVDNAMNMGMSHEALAEVVGSLAKRGRPGSALMRRLVRARGAGYVPPASELEARFFDLIAAYGLAVPVRQLDSGGEAWVGRVDAAYPDRKVLIELDSRRHWERLLEAQADRARDNELMAAGWRMLRFTWAMVVDQPDSVLRVLRTALAA